MRVQRVSNFLGFLLAVERRDGLLKIAIMDQRDEGVGVVAPVRHGNVEMLHAHRDVADHLAELHLPVGPGRAVDKDTHRRVVLADAVDASGKMILRAKRRLHEAIDNLAVGESFLLAALA